MRYGIDKQGEKGGVGWRGRRASKLRQSCVTPTAKSVCSSIMQQCCRSTSKEKGKKVVQYRRGIKATTCKVQVYDVGGNGVRGALVDSDKESLHAPLLDISGLIVVARSSVHVVRPLLSISVTDGHEYWKDFRGYHKEISSSSRL